jgi:NADPH-dependent 2,4-dienoyl-CoA reductase/sulfur reductase-like enzyme
VPKSLIRFDGCDARIVSLYARGLSVREIQARLKEPYGTEVSAGLGQSHMPEVTRTPVLIAGGGPVGSTLALDLASRRIDVIVPEQTPADQMRGVKCNHAPRDRWRFFGSGAI